MYDVLCYFLRACVSVER